MKDNGEIADNSETEDDLGKEDDPKTQDNGGIDGVGEDLEVEEDGVEEPVHGELIEDEEQMERVLEFEPRRREFGELSFF